MQCPGDWENGFKEGRVMRFGDGERSLSHMVSGDWQGATFTLLISDFDRSIRERLNSEADRYWSEPLTVKITNRATRAAKGTPFVVFVGPIIEAQPAEEAGMAWDITLGDIVSQGLLSEAAQAPWRRIGDGFLSQFTKVADGLDLDTPEDTIYGIHKRFPDHPASGEGFVYKPTYLGIMDLGGDTHVWLVCGHACAAVPEQYVDFVPSLEFTVLNGVDYRSDTFGNDRRYTLITAAVTDPGFLDPEVEIDQDPDVITDPDACALGIKSLTTWVEGVEPNGDGSGAVITDRIDQYKHFAINYVANQAAASYQSGPWLTNPSWNVFGVDVPIVDTASWTAVKAISLLRFPGDGYTGAAIIGGTRKSLTAWIADWNRSSGTRFGITNLGRMKVFMLHPTAAIKAAAPLVEETNDILKGSFKPWVRWRMHANSVPLFYDPNHESGEFMGVETLTDGISITGYRRAISPDELKLEVPFAPGITNASHIGTILLRQLRFPPRGVTVETALGPLTTMDLGDYVRYRHFASIGASASEIRLGVIERHQVQAGKRRVQADILDVEDLIGFDEEVPVDDASPGNDRCGGAIEITLDEENHFSTTINTSANTTDTTLDDQPGLLSDAGGPPVAYHAAWFKFTAPDVGNFSFVTTASGYDTVLAFLTGTCGSPVDWTVEGVNDNFPPGVLTSGIAINMTLGQELYVLVYGYGPDDGGTLVATVTFAPEI